MFDLFDDEARRVIELAQEESRRLRVERGIEQVRAAVDQLAPDEDGASELAGDRYHAVPDPSSWPLCPQCGTELAGGASAFRTVGVSMDGDEPIDVAIVYCSGCGRSLGVLSG